MTKTELARRVGLTTPAITGFESRRFGASTETLRSVAQALEFPQSFFSAPEVDQLLMSDTTFRSLRSMTARLRDRALASGALASEVISPALWQWFEPRSIEMPDLSGRRPSEAAEEVRRSWDLGEGPIHNMVHLLERQGAQVYWLDDPSQKVDAFSFWRDGAPYVFLNSAKGLGDRQRMNAAHELGHLLLHRHEPLPPDRDLEKEAFGFAASLLLPTVQFAREAPRHVTLDHFVPLKMRWGVSISAMIVRCKGLGIFTQWQYEDAFKDLGRRGWRRLEPSPIELEESRLHVLVLNGLEQHRVSAAEFAAGIDLYPELLAELMPAAARRFDQQAMRRAETKKRLRVIDSRGTTNTSNRAG